MAKEFRYRDSGRKAEAIMKRSKWSGGGYDTYIRPEFQMFKPREGENTIRILPRTWDDVDRWKDWWNIEIWLHYNVGADEGMYLCLKRMKDEECPICEAQRETSDPDERTALRVSGRPLVWLIDRDNEQAGPMWWAMPASLFRDINNRSVDKKTGAGILIDKEDGGYDVTFIREGTDLRTKYVSVDVARDASPLHELPKKAARWLDYIEQNPLPDLLNIYDADYLEKVLSGTASKRQAADDDEEEGSTRPGKRRAARAAVDEDEDDEDEAPSKAKRRATNGGDEDEDEEEAPRGRRRAARAADEDEDDEEEEAPRKKKVVRAKLEEADGEDEDDEDEDGGDDAQEDDEDDDEETPPKKVARRRPSSDDDEEPTSQAKRKLQRLRK